VVTGATLHRLEDEYDTGDIVASETLEVGEKNGWQLARALDRPSLRLLLAAARWASRGQPLAAQPQSSRAATWAGEPEESQRRVDWRWSTERVLRRIRALSPVPGLALEVDRVKFFVTHALAVDPPTLALAPGEAALLAGQLLIRTGDGAVSVQRAVLADGEAELDGRAMANLLAERTGAAR
jgi:methionyl-tRNA formyltransferase